MQRFDNKVAFITGAASGIGLATAKRLGGEGASLFACDINAEGLEREMSALRDSGVDITYRVLDVSDDAACAAAVAECVATFGKLDILCNIAGMVCTGHFTELTAERWRRVMDVNINSVFVLSLAAMPHLLESGGNIVNIASTAGIAGLPYNSAYCASKAAVLNFSRALATEYASRGVRVNAVCPGGVNTPLIQNAQAPEGADLALFGRMSPLTPYMAEAEEIAGAVAYLASAEARFVTGSGLVIDGGQTAI
ncbi:SDR family NAD(P)-dependent oxidoreductase [Parahaliea aestuarii]|uniref:SDR family oxidoreductase n=1 Tax=Parahaliea aestuarii TaxID=1852021 RepID=A0A5C9A0J8_9GAMM|nr:SDR family oxidoreductase [Parahaliea aestuarii]TXS93514.1 SDR family oxidoreductase [Parahaliea aestuarii]